MERRLGVLPYPRNQLDIGIVIRSLKTITHDNICVLPQGPRFCISEFGAALWSTEIPLVWYLFRLRTQVVSISLTSMPERTASVASEIWRLGGSPTACSITALLPS